MRGDYMEARTRVWSLRKLRSICHAHGLRDSAAHNARTGGRKELDSRTSTSSTADWCRVVVDLNPSVGDVSCWCLFWVPITRWCTAWRCPLRRRGRSAALSRTVCDLATGSSSSSLLESNKLSLIWSMYDGSMSFYNLCSFSQSLWTLF
jgi:hypothetical protein